MVLPGTSFVGLPFSEDSNQCVLAGALSGVLGNPCPPTVTLALSPMIPASNVIPIPMSRAFRTAMLALGFPYDVMTSEAHDLVVGVAPAPLPQHTSPL
jgi:hypothetical protein